MAFKSIKSVIDFGIWFWKKYSSEKGEGMAKEKGEGTPSKKRKRIEQQYSSEKGEGMAKEKDEGTPSKKRKRIEQQDLIATAGADSNAVAFDRPSGQVVSTLGGHSKKVTSVKFAAEGEIEVTGSAYKPSEMNHDYELNLNDQEYDVMKNRNRSFHTEVESRRSDHNFVEHEGVPSLPQLVDLCFNMMTSNFLTQNQFTIALNLVEQWLSSGQRNAWLIFLHNNTSASLEERANFLIQLMG